MNWGPRITAIPVISTEGILDVGIFRGKNNEATFLTFVRNILAPVLLPFNGVNPRSVVVMGMPFLFIFPRISLQYILSTLDGFSFCSTHSSQNAFRIRRPGRLCWASVKTSGCHNISLKVKIDGSNSVSYA